MVTYPKDRLGPGGSRLYLTHEQKRTFKQRLLPGNAFKDWKPGTPAGAGVAGWEEWGAKGSSRVWDREGEGDLSCVPSVLETTGFSQDLWVMGMLLSGVSPEHGASSIEVTSSPSFPCGWRGGEGESQRLGQP